LIQLSLPRQLLRKYISTQLNNLFPDENVVDLDGFSKEFDIAIDRIDYCFSRVAHERYNTKGQTILNHLYGDQYLIFTWFLANTIWKERGTDVVATKLYYLNRVLHGFDCMYDTGLPDIFLIFHGSGTMLGKAVYSNFFISFQGCTVGASKGKYAVFGKGVALTAHSSVIGDCSIGNKVTIGNNTALFQKSIPDDTMVFSDKETGKLTLKKTDLAYAQQFFNVSIDA